MSYLRVDKLGRPPKKGSTYLVPCIVYRRSLAEWEDWEKVDNLKLIPVYDRIHSDKENGQDYPHFHVDYRFVKDHDFSYDELVITKTGLQYYQKVYSPSRINIKDGRIPTIRYKPMRCVSSRHSGITPNGLISKCKLKHDCIYKGKCPHRGYDLSNEEAVDGIITCPLHGLQFDSVTGKIINHINIEVK